MIGDLHFADDPQVIFILHGEKMTVRTSEIESMVRMRNLLPEALKNSLMNGSKVSIKLKNGTSIEGKVLDYLADSDLFFADDPQIHFVNLEGVNSIRLSDIRKAF